MPGNLNAFQLGPGAVVQLQTNQGEILAVVTDAESPTYSPPPSTTPSTGFPSIDVSDNTNQTIVLNVSAVLALTGLPPGRVQWLQFLVIQGAAGGPYTLSLRVNGVPARTPANAGLVLSTAANARDIVSAYWDGSTLYALVAGKDFRNS